MRADNSHHLTTAARNRSAAARRRVTTALQSLSESGDPVTFDVVAAKAGVSRSWLYSTVDVRDHIIELRGRNSPPDRGVRSQQTASDDSLRTRLVITQERLRDVLADNKALRSQLEQALGRIRAERLGS